MGHPAEHGFYLLCNHPLPVDVDGIMCDLGCAEEGDRGAGSVERWELGSGGCLCAGLAVLGGLSRVPTVPARMFRNVWSRRSPPMSARRGRSVVYVSRSPIGCPASVRVR
jgi:hypothetical protein